MALGAGRSTLLRLVLGQGLKLASVGVALGLAASLALTKLLSDFLYGANLRKLDTGGGCSGCASGLLHPRAARRPSCKLWRMSQ